jgi:hypothetical protein
MFEIGHELGHPTLYTVKLPAMTTTELGYDPVELKARTYTDIPSNIGPVRALLEEYSGVPANDIDDHIRAIVRDRQPVILGILLTYCGAARQIVGCQTIHVYWQISFSFIVLQSRPAIPGCAPAPEGASVNYHFSRHGLLYWTGGAESSV